MAPPAPEPTPIQRALGALMIVWLSVTAMGGTIFIALGWFLLPFSRKLFRAWEDMIAAVWFCTPLLFLEVFLGMKFRITSNDGTLPKQPESVLLIANHRTRLDWMILWGFCLRAGGLQRNKIILKAGLKRLPFVGWSMQSFRFLFLARDWVKDEKHLRRLLGSFVSQKYPQFMLIFPEGTDLSDHNLNLSHEFSKAKGLPTYNNVLHPKTKGFIACIEALRAKSHLSAVYDLTMGYSDIIPQTEKFLINGTMPREVHVQVCRHEIASLPTDEAGLEKWCQQRFAEKERVLEEFKKTKVLPGKAVNLPRGIVLAKIIGANLLWAGLLFYILPYIWASRVLFWGALTIVVALAVTSEVKGGLENLELDVIERLDAR